MKIYANFVEPEKYPKFNKRQISVVTHRDLNNKIQFTSARFFHVNKEKNEFINIEKTINQYTKDNIIGNCFWPNWKTLQIDNIKELIDALAKKNLWLFGFWGFVPGEKSDKDSNPWGEFSVSNELNNYLLNKFNGHFFGYELGEQDGRYIGSYAPRESTFLNARSRENQYISFYKFMRKMEDNFHNHVSILASLPYHHYFARDNSTSFLGCASAQALPNTQMWYSFIRGASKQYGLLCFGNVSVWNRWGYKTYSSTKDLPQTKTEVGPEAGTSLSLMKRLLFSHYMYNCDMLGIEQGWFYFDDTEKYIYNSSDVNTEQLMQRSPIGELQQSINTFIKKNGKPGVMYTPFALIMDSFSGWVPPRTLFSKNIYQVWGCLPYNSGDFQTHSFFSLLFPGYENSGFFKNESGFLTSTPLGEMTDVLLSDAPIEIIKRYKTIFIVNNTTLNFELFSKIKEYVLLGGQIIVFGSLVHNNITLSKFDNDYLSFFGIKSTNNLCETAENIDISFNKKIYSIKKLDLYFDEISANPIATALNGKIIASQNNIGNGSVILINAEDGLEKHNFSGVLSNSLNNYIPSPCDFSQFVKDIFKEIILSKRIVFPTNEYLQYIVDVKSKNKLTLLINNNSYIKQRFNIDSNIRLSNIFEIETYCDLSEHIGYYPQNCNINNSVSLGEGNYEIKSGESKIFDISLEENLELEKELYPKKDRVRCYVRLPKNYSSPLDFVLKNPSFYQNFSGLLIDATWIENHDIEFIKKEASALKTFDISIFVDFESLFNHFPDLSFYNSFIERREESYRRLESILEKILEFNCIGIIVSAIHNPEGNSDTEMLKENIIEIISYLHEKTKNNYIRIIVKNTPVVFDCEELFSIVGFLDYVDLSYNISVGISSNLPFKSIIDKFNIPFLIASSPCSDEFGQYYNSQSPIYNSKHKHQIQSIINEYIQSGGATIILNSDYQDYSELYADYKSIDKIII